MFKSYANAIQNYTTFRGCTTRPEFWYYMFQFAFLSVLTSFAAGYSKAGALINIGFVLFMVIPHMAMLARRLHDSGLSGWWQLLVLVPVIGGAVVLILCLRRSRIDSPYRLNGDQITADQYGPLLIEEPSLSEKARIF